MQNTITLQNAEIIHEPISSKLQQELHIQYTKAKEDYMHAHEVSEQAVLILHSRFQKSIKSWEDIIDKSKAFARMLLESKMSTTRMSTKEIKATYISSLQERIRMTQDFIQLPQEAMLVIQADCTEVSKLIILFDAQTELKLHKMTDEKTRKDTVLCVRNTRGISYVQKLLAERNPQQQETYIA